MIFHVIRLILNLTIPATYDFLRLSDWRLWLSQGNYTACLEQVHALSAAVTSHSEGGTALADTPPLAAAQVRSIARSLQVGDYVTASWGLGSEVGTWFGHITSRAQPGLPAVANWTQEECQACGVIKNMEPVLVSLPATGLVYYTLQSAATPPQVSTCTCQPDDDESDEDELENQVPVATTHRPYDPAPRPRLDTEAVWHAPLDMPLVASGDCLRGDALLRLHIFVDRPHHVHSLGWSRFATSTRKAHVRWLLLLQTMDHDLQASPLGFAIVERILRLSKRRQWRPSTVARAFSDVGHLTPPCEQHNKRHAPRLHVRFPS